MATRTIGMPIPWYHHDLEESYTKTQPVDICRPCVAQTHGTLDQYCTTTDYSTGMYQRQAAFACLDHLIYFHNSASCPSSHHTSTQVKYTMSSVTPLMCCQQQPRVSSSRNSSKSCSKQQLGEELHKFRGWSRHPPQRETNFRG